MPLCRPAAPKHAGKQVKRGMPKIPLYYQDGEFFEEFGTSCYINHEKMVDVFPLYRHDFIEISLILDGCGTELCNGKYYPVQAGLGVCFGALALPHAAHGFKPPCHTFYL